MCLDESSVVEDLEDLFPGNLIGHPIENGHFLVGQPGLAGQSGGNLGVLVLVIGPLGRVLGLPQGVIDDSRVGQGAVSRLLLIFMDWDGIPSVRDGGCEVLGRGGTDDGQREKEDGVHLEGESD